MSALRCSHRATVDMWAASTHSQTHDQKLKKWKSKSSNVVVSLRSPASLSRVCRRLFFRNYSEMHFGLKSIKVFSLVREIERPTTTDYSHNLCYSFLECVNNVYCVPSIQRTCVCTLRLCLIHFSRSSVVQTMSMGPTTSAAAAHISHVKM